MFLCSGLFFWFLYCGAHLCQRTSKSIVYATFFCVCSSFVASLGVSCGPPSGTKIHCVHNDSVLFFLLLFLVVCPLNTHENLPNHRVHNNSVSFFLFLFLVVCPLNEQWLGNLAWGAQSSREDISLLFSTRNGKGNCPEGHRAPGRTFPYCFH